MKIVDEKGKLFGKINLIDLLALLLIAAVVIFGIVRGVQSIKPDSNSTNSTTKLTYTTQIQALDPVLYEEVLRQMEAAGGRDQLMAGGEMVDAYVVKVEAKNHLNYVFNDAGELLVYQEDGEHARLDVIFTVEAQVEDVTTNLVGTQEVRVAKNHILKTTHFEFPYTTILTCDWD